MQTPTTHLKRLERSPQQADADMLADMILAERTVEAKPVLIDRVEQDELDLLREQWRQAVRSGDHEEAERIARKGKRLKETLLQSSSQLIR